MNAKEVKGTSYIMKGYDIMKTTIKGIREALETIKGAKFERIEGKVEDLKGNFITEQVKSFNIDLGNATAQNTINQWECANSFQLDVKGSISEMFGKVDEMDETTLAEYNYYCNVESIARKGMTSAIRPITERLGDMFKAILTNDLTTFNNHMKVLFDIEISNANFKRMKDIVLSGRKTGLNTMSAPQFANTFMHLMLARAVVGGNYSPKKVKGCLNKAIKDVPTLTFEQAMNLDTLTVDTMVEVCNIKIKKDRKDDFAYKAEKVREKFYTSIAIKPMSLVK